MLDERGIQELAQQLTNEKLGMVILAGLPRRGDILFRCFSTIEKTEVFRFMEAVCFCLTMKPLNRGLTDELVIATKNEDLNDKVFWLMAELDPQPPIIVCIANDAQMAAYVLGRSEIAVFGATRMMSILKTEGDFKMFRFYPSVN